MNVNSVKCIVLLIEVPLLVLKFFPGFPAIGGADFRFLSRGDEISGYRGLGTTQERMSETES